MRKIWTFCPTPSTQWIQSNSGEKIDVDNPANGQIIGKVPKCSTSETSKAIDEAQKAFPAWRDKTAKERSVILQKWARLIEENVDDLAKIMTVEQGKPLAEAKGEILMGVTYIDFYAEEGKSYLTIAIGCTGGKHRSVFVAEHLYAWLKQKDYKVTLKHRDLIE